MLGKMPLRRGSFAPLIAALLALLISGCGSSKSSNSSDANSAATGDIPDNQVFLTYRNQAAGYSILYPEGWARKGSATRTSFQDKNNLIRVVVKRGSQPTVASVKSDLQKQRAAAPSLNVTSAQALTIAGKPVVKVTYSSESTPNAVTGKRVKLVVDRYAYYQGGRVAIVDLGTAVGVDNVDAYRMISRSFKWR